MRTRLRLVLVLLGLTVAIAASPVAMGACDRAFRRGDANQDELVDISDAIAILTHLFVGEFTPACLKSVDVDDSGVLDVTDPIALLGFAFLGTAPPPKPGPSHCGPDPTPDALSCLAYAPCPPLPCDSNDCCEEGFYCAREPGECDGDTAGTCRERPLGCPRNFDPVCGCDGRTYPNECTASSAGVNVRHRDECGPGECTDNADCDRGFYCSKVEVECDGPGTCKERHLFCILVFDPVCGCDGKTYGNSCQAAGAGVSVLHKGECDAPR